MPEGKEGDENASLYMPPAKVRRRPFFIGKSLRLSDADYFAMFRKLDLDRVGNFSITEGDLNHDEMATILHKFGLNDQQRAKFFELLSLDDDGCVSFHEFKRIMPLCMEEINLTCAERIYLTFEDPNSSVVAQKLSLIMLIFIMLSTVTFVIESLPLLRSPPEGCNSVSISCEPILSPVPEGIMMTIETICVLGFTMDYFARLLMVSFVRPHVLGHAAHGDIHPIFHFNVDVYGTRKKAALVDKRHGFKMLRLNRFFWAPMNLVDLIAIAPFYVEKMVKTEGGGDGLLVLRMLRLGRVFRVLKVGKHNKGLIIFVNAFTSAANVLVLLFVVICLICVLFGTLLQFSEGGKWYEPLDNCIQPDGTLVVCETLYPNGAYLRETYLGNPLHMEESPYRSIVHSCWAVMTTITTVGYGDLYPTSPAGKTVAACSMIIGLLIVALPITVIGGAFAREVQQHEAHGDQNRQQEKVDYIHYLESAIQGCPEGSDSHKRLSRKLRLIVQHENEVHVSSADDKVPGAGGSDYVVLTMARKMKSVELELAKLRNEQEQRMDHMEATLQAIGMQCGVPAAKLKKKVVEKTELPKKGLRDQPSRNFSGMAVTEANEQKILI